ncbi:hypothetical protein [uncultured Hyphomonas sp.]|uniref:hypothetical protein n=1 Tax=uncultured Hyphomonas sp. TaxID=225298 RepID=UPI00262930BA|nr:hypothetical protein [uncultured Hyphomonas sp.]
MGAVTTRVAVIAAALLLAPLAGAQAANTAVASRADDVAIDLSIIGGICAASGAWRKRHAAA